MSLQVAFISFCLFLFSGAFAYPSAKFQIGSPASMLSQLPDQGEPSLYTFTSPIGEQITGNVDHYSFENGWLAMSGDPKISGSDFILKGTERNLYGWIVVREKNLAYEYTTHEDGLVYVEQVPMDHIYPVCNLGEDHDSQRAAVEEDPAFENLYHLNNNAPEDHIKPWADQDLYKLQSLPGSKYVLFLNIKDVMNGDTPKHHTKEKMYQAWQIFASTYSMFDLNVTTDAAVHTAAGRANAGINHLDNVSGRSFCCIGCFGTGRQCETQLRSSSEYPYTYGKTMAHESGHGVGLQHDGSSSTDYFSGLSTYEWSPTMGNNVCCKSWANALPQWSKGEYSGANQKQDDLERILRNPFGYRSDDIPGTKGLVINNGKVNPASNRGQISTSTDTDTWTFTLSSPGHIKITIDRTEPNGGSALDVDASLFNGTGSLIAQDNKTRVRSASFDRDLVPGSYRIVIKGGAEGTPSNGFSNYATMGFYAISGDITGSVGIEELDLKRFVTVTQGSNAKINLDIPVDSKIQDMTLFSTKGTAVFTSDERTNSIDISKLKAGIYVLKMKVNGSSWERKIVKN